jgi:hypothetical protein
MTQIFGAVCDSGNAEAGLDVLPLFHPQFGQVACPRNQIHLLPDRFQQKTIGA